MYKVLPKLFGILLFVLIVLGFFSQPSKHVLATPCSGTGCNGTDPHETGCDGNASTVSTVYPANAKLELRRSVNCITLWTRITNLASGNRYPRATLRKYYATKTYRNTTYTIAPNAFIWTKQYYNNGGMPIDSDWYSCGLVASTYSPTAVTDPCTPVELYP